MNYHLNLFKPYYQGDRVDPIENNLTRSLAIVLQNDSLFLYKFIELTIDKISETAQGLTREIFTELRNPEDLNISIQINMREYDDEIFDNGVIAACLTMQAYEMECFNSMLPCCEPDAIRISDIVIQLNSALFVIEVKSNSSDCRQQLYDQVFNLKQCGNILKGSSITWTDILQILYTLRSLRQRTYEKNVFVEDYTNLLETHFPFIIPALPFSSFRFNAVHSSLERQKMYRRLHKCVVQLREQSNYQLGEYYDRIPVLVDWGWAREVSFWFAEDVKEGEYLFGYIWPANTKGQGHHVYTRPLDWINKKNIRAGQHELALQICYEVKLCHFNRYVSSIKFGNEQLKPGMMLNTRDNFYETGKYKREDSNGYSWQDLADWLDEHFIENFDWRKQCGWTENFLESNRAYLTVSFGFQVRCLIPYELLQNIDKKDSDFKKVSVLMSDLVTAYQHLLD